MLKKPFRSFSTDKLPYMLKMYIVILFSNIISQAFSVWLAFYFSYELQPPLQLYYAVPHLFPLYFSITSYGIYLPGINKSLS